MKTTDIADVVTGIVCDEFGVTADRVRSASRKHEYVQARMALTTILRKEFMWNLKPIAMYLNRDHTTILHSIWAHGQDYETSPLYRLSFDAAKSRVMNMARTLGILSESNYSDKAEV